MHTHSLTAGGSTEEGTVHSWAARGDFRKERHFRLALKDKQNYEGQNRGKYSRKKEQYKPRHGGLQTPGHRGAQDEQIGINTTQGAQVGVPWKRDWKG